ncbi:GHKL domain-containing protein, partial [Fulvivirga sp. RKSG066]|uniref:sensor histidine kinase n=1 Tax=Fulvivirga aurantia TaxID=2529383 RepID=UPI0012BD70E9
KILKTNNGYQERVIDFDNGAYFLSITGRNDTLWVSDKYIVHQYVKDTKQFSIDLSERGLFSFNIHMDKRGELWVSQDNAPGLVKLTKEGMRQEYREEKGIFSRILILSSDTNGDLWAGGSGENSYLYKYDVEADQFVNKSATLNQELNVDFEVIDLASRNDSVWLATTAGLMLYHNEEIKPIDLGATLTGLPVKAVELGKNYLWFSTTNGVARYNLRSKEFLLFNESSGLNSRSGNPRALRMGQRGTIWVGTAKGISYAEDGNGDLFKTKKPLVSGIELDAQKLSVDELNGTLIRNNAFVKVTFNSLTLPGNSIEYEIKGRDAKEWTSIGNRNFIQIPNAQQGKYTISIRAKQQGDYLWSEPLHVSFEVDQPIYFKWWFIALAVLGTIVVIVFINKFNTIRLKNLERHLNRVVEERTELLQQTNDELIQTNKELDMFVYSASHDLKAPLSSLTGLLDLYELEKEKKKREELIKMMRGSVLKLDTFIKEVIDYSKNSRLDVVLEDIDFKDLINEILDSYRYMENCDRVKTEVKVEQGTYMADKSRLRIILNNLISNAIKYCHTEKKDCYININVYKKSNQICLDIEDNGIGIDPEYLPKIYQMFYRANDSKFGSGLGLYIVKESVENLGGTIDICSEVEKGTSVFIKIPDVPQRQS